MPPQVRVHRPHVPINRQILHTVAGHRQTHAHGHAVPDTLVRLPMAIHHVQTVVRDITVPVVQRVCRARRVHTVQRSI